MLFNFKKNITFKAIEKHQLDDNLFWKTSEIAKVVASIHCFLKGSNKYVGLKILSSYDWYNFYKDFETVVHDYHSLNSDKNSL